MKQEIADLIAPLVRDHINHREDSYYYGCFVGACDTLGKLGLITDAEYSLMTDAADRDPLTLLATLHGAEPEASAQMKRNTHTQQEQSR